jgi:hypothetical protein
MAGLAGKKAGGGSPFCGETVMAQDRPETYMRTGPSAGGTVNGWLVAILLILVAAL